VSFARCKSCQYRRDGLEKSLVKIAAKLDASRVTLREIANATGVSRMTVSAALRGDGRVAPMTREKILAEARRLGYTPNSRLSRLMTEVAAVRHRTYRGLLAYLHTEETKDGWEKNDGKSYDAICKRAEHYGYQVEPFWVSDPELSPDRINRILWSRGVEGIIMPNLAWNWFCKGKRTFPLDWSKFCAVEINDTIIKPTLNLVRHNHFEGIVNAIGRLESMGYRRIGLCLKSEDDLRTHHRWTAAYLLWHTMRGLPSSLKPLLADDIKAPALKAWVDRHQIEVVVSPGLAVLRGLREAGYSVPDEVGFASLDLWGNGWSTVTGVDQQHAKMLCPMAVDFLVNLIYKRARGVPENPIQWIYPGVWRNGKTTRQQTSAPPVKNLSEELLRIEG